MSALCFCDRTLLKLLRNNVKNMKYVNLRVGLIATYMHSNNDIICVLGMCAHPRSHLVLHLWPERTK